MCQLRFILTFNSSYVTQFKEHVSYMPFELKPTIEENLLWHVIGDSKENSDKCKCFVCVIPLFTQHTQVLSVS